MRNAHPNSKWIYTLEEFGDMVRANDEYASVTNDILKSKMKIYGRSYCDECGSEKGTFHINSFDSCKYYKQGRDLWLKTNKTVYKELGEFTKYYDVPNDVWMEVNLAEYRENPEYQCRICEKWTREKGGLCDEHEKKLFTRLRKSRQLYKLAYEEAQLAEIEFYKYETIKLAKSLET